MYINSLHHFNLLLLLGLLSRLNAVQSSFTVLDHVVVNDTVSTLELIHHSNPQLNFDNCEIMLTNDEFYINPYGLVEFGTDLPSKDFFDWSKLSLTGKFSTDLNTTLLSHNCSSDLTTLFCNNNGEGLGIFYGWSNGLRNYSIEIKTEISGLIACHDEFHNVLIAQNITMGSWDDDFSTLSSSNSALSAGMIGLISIGIFFAGLLIIYLRKSPLLVHQTFNTLKNRFSFAKDASLYAPLDGGVEMREK